MSPSSIAAVLALLLWAVLTFVRPVGLGIVHLLLVIGFVLWIRGWALTSAKSEERGAKR